MALDDGTPTSENGRGQREHREYRLTGLADLLPDWFLPPEGKQHVRNARKELLLAVRSMIDQAIETQERGVRIRRTPAKIEIE
jgi:hypothetical protein